MFNSPILDVTIGLVFVFLIYSLLATTIHEIIASSISLRARMLRKGIVVGMLSNTPDVSKLEFVVKNFLSYFNWVKTLFNRVKALFNWVKAMYTGEKILFTEQNRKDPIQMIGQRVFDHPLIKNYGSSRIFPLPSYIPTKNFSSVLIDILKTDFNSKIKEIAKGKIARVKVNTSDSVEQLNAAVKEMQVSSDVVKIKELIEYYH